MGIPGFTGEVSLYQTSGHYRLAAVSTGNAGIHVVPAQRGITPFSGGGSRQCLPDTTGDCPQTGFEIFLCDSNDCTPTGDCCTPPPPPPPPTRAQCDQNYTACMVPCGFIPFPFNLPCVHDCNTALCDCLLATGTFPPGTVLNCGI